MIFLHYTLWKNPGNEPFNAWEEMGICADMMAAFPAHWTLAHPAAAGGLALSSGRTPWPGYESDKAWRQAIKSSFQELTQQVMGRRSAYGRLERWEDGAAVIAAGEQQPATPGSLFHIAPQSASAPGAVGGGQPVGSIRGGITSRATPPFEGADASEAHAGHVDVFAGGLSFMDFL
ncbi:Fc.00g036310.m01.CDS01 [Cosmosporella sp. VM-42]